MLAKSQSQPYTPMDLDTSSFWIQEYKYYYGSPYVEISGEVLQYVAGDTSLNNQTYKIIRGYCTRSHSHLSSGYDYLQAKLLACYNPTIYIREDTASKQILMLGGNNSTTQEVELLSYNLSVNDAMSYIPPVFGPVPLSSIDSIKYYNYFGVNRRSIYNRFSLYAYVRIEGIGATLNFPDFGASEWNTPMFVLNTYVKNNTVLYKRDQYSIDSCYRKAKINYCSPVNSSHLSKKTFTYTFSHNTLLVQNPQNEKLKIVLLNLQGSVLFEQESQESRIKKEIRNIASGIYILSIQSSHGVQNKKIFVP